MKKIDYYFDFLSPYSYFSWKNTKELRENPKLEIALKPVVMGTLFNNWEIKGPGEIAPKRVQMLKHCFQYAAIHGIDFHPPKSHPFNPLYALRLACKNCAGDIQEQIIDFLWDLCWAKGIGLGDEEVLKEKLSEAGFAADELLEKTFNREVKQELKANNKEAIAQKAFGVPSFVYNDELYWGNDSIELLIDALSDSPHVWNKDLFNDRIKDVKL